MMSKQLIGQQLHRMPTILTPAPERLPASSRCRSLKAAFGTHGWLFKTNFVPL